MPNLQFTLRVELRKIENEVEKTSQNIKQEDLLNEKSTENRMVSVLFAGGDDRDRTDDLLNAIQTRSQLRYTPGL